MRGYYGTKIPATCSLENMRTKVLRTVGHGTLASDSFISLVQSARIRNVVDVRRFPGSRRHPQFAREAMAQWVPAAGIGYSWEQKLGGFRKPKSESLNLGLRHMAFRAYADYMQTADFWHALDPVLDSIAVDTDQEGFTAVMCSESLWWRCHRRLIADAAVLARGVRVEHLFHDGRLQLHVLTPEARLQDGVLVYPELNERLI